MLSTQVEFQGEHYRKPSKSFRQISLDALRIHPPMYRFILNKAIEPLEPFAIPRSRKWHNNFDLLFSSYSDFYQILRPCRHIKILKATRESVSSQKYQFYFNSKIIFIFGFLLKASKGGEEKAIFIALYISEGWCERQDAIIFSLSQRQRAIKISPILPSFGKIHLLNINVYGHWWLYCSVSLCVSHCFPFALPSQH